VNTFGVEYNYDTVVIAVGLHIARSVLESVCMSKLPSVAMLDGVLESARIGDGLSGCASRMVRRAPLVLDAASTLTCMPSGCRRALTGVPIMMI